MKRIMLVGTFMLIATPALAARHPIHQHVTRSDTSLAAIRSYESDASSELAVRHHHWHHHHAHFHHQHREAHHSHKHHHIASTPSMMARRAEHEAGHSFASREAIEPPKDGQPTGIKINPEPSPSILEASLEDTAILGFDGEIDGMAAPRPTVIRSRPYHITGKIKIASADYDFATGGSGRGSIPYGDYPITTDPKELGPWGRRHHALGLAHNNGIYDPKLHDTREGVYIHAARHMASAGCVAIREFDEAKHAIMHMIESFGSAFIHIWPGIASITPQRSIGVHAIAFYQPEASGGKAADNEDRHHGNKHYARQHHRYRNHIARHRHHRIHYARA